MRNRNYRVMLAAGVVTAAGMGIGSAAQAQNAPRPLAVKLGVHLPSDNVLRNETDSAWFLGGLSYDIAARRKGLPLVYQFYFDITQRDRRYFGVSGTASLGSSSGNGTLSFWGIGPAIKLCFAPFTAPGQPYAGIGAGYYKARVPAYGTSYVPDYTRTEARFGGKLFAGYQLNSGFFGEADYTVIGSINGTTPGGTGFRIGYRF